jgi:hypothetical protein
MMLQLNPPLPVVTPKGSGYAVLVVDYSQEHHLMWVVALDEGGQLWMFENPQVRLAANFTLGRKADPTFAAGGQQTYSRQANGHQENGHLSGSNGRTVPMAAAH